MVNSVHFAILNRKEIWFKCLASTNQPLNLIQRVSFIAQPFIFCIRLPIPYRFSLLKQSVTCWTSFRFAFEVPHYMLDTFSVKNESHVIHNKRMQIIQLWKASKMQIKLSYLLQNLHSLIQLLCVCKSLNAQHCFLPPVGIIVDSSDIYLNMKICWR